MTWLAPFSILEPIVFHQCYDPSLDPAAIEPVSLVVFGLIGLLGGAHCLGMCGPLVTTYSDRMRKQNEGSSRRNQLTLGIVRQHALFNLGRTGSYAVLGGIFGLAGSLVFVNARTVTAVVTDVHAVAGIVVGVVIIAMGLHYLLGRGLLGGSVTIPGVESVLSRVQQWLVAHVDSWVGDTRIVGLGAAHGLLPCPLLYPAFLYAFVQGSPRGGFLALAVLGLGTVPSMFIYGTLFQSLSVETRIKLHRVLGVAFLALGYIPLQHGLMTLGVHLPAIPLPHYQPI